MSTSLLEAIYCKNIIIATPYEGADELEICKMEVANSETKMIAKVIIRVLENLDEFRADLEDNKNYIIDNFSWEKSARKYEEALV